MDRLFAVLSADVIGSRRVTDRKDLLGKLLQGVDFLNRTLERWRITPFRIVGGDGLQGVLSSPVPLPRALLGLKAVISPYPLRVIVGWGKISTGVLDDPSLMDGEVFLRTSEALKRAKARGREVVFSTGIGEIDEVADMVYSVAEVLWRKWRPQLWRRVKRFLETDSIQEVARLEGVTYQAIYKEFNLRGVLRVIEAGNALSRWMGRYIP